MSHHFNKYKSACTALMVACYLAGGMQFPLLECLHFFSHLGDISKNNYCQHSYQSHGDDHDHDHAALQVLEAVSGGANGPGAPINAAPDFELKKQPQWPANVGHLVFAAQKKQPFKGYSAPFLPTVFPAILTPPPRV